MNYATPNGLAEKFQLKPDHHDDHIFDEERAMILELRQKMPCLDQCSDKFLLYFLFARRHDVPQTIELLKRYIDVKHECGFDKEMPPFDDLVPLLQVGPFMHIPHTVDNHDRILLYYWLAKDFPKKRDFKTFVHFGVFLTEFMVAVEPLKHLRNGMAMVIDLADVRWQNLDISSKAKKVGQSLVGVFPWRIRQVYLINGYSIVKIALRLAALVYPAKLLQRVTIMKEVDLIEHIPSEHLHVAYGGELKYTVEDWISICRQARDPQSTSTSEI